MLGAQGWAQPCLYISATTRSPAFDSGVLRRHFLPSASKRSPPCARMKLTSPSLAELLKTGGITPYTVVRPPSDLVSPFARVCRSSKVHLPSPGGILRP